MMTRCLYQSRNKELPFLLTMSTPLMLRTCWWPPSRWRSRTSHSLLYTILTGPMPMIFQLWTWYVQYDQSLFSVYKFIALWFIPLSSNLSHTVHSERLPITGCPRLLLRPLQWASSWNSKGVSVDTISRGWFPSRAGKRKSGFERSQGKHILLSLSLWIRKLCSVYQVEPVDKGFAKQRKLSTQPSCVTSLQTISCSWERWSMAIVRSQFAQHQHLIKNYVLCRKSM